MNVLKFGTQLFKGGREKEFRGILEKWIILKMITRARLEDDEVDDLSGGSVRSACKISLIFVASSRLAKEGLRFISTKEGDSPILPSQFVGGPRRRSKP